MRAEDKTIMINDGVNNKREEDEEIMIIRRIMRGVKKTIMVMMTKIMRDEDNTIMVVMMKIRIMRERKRRQ